MLLEQEWAKNPLLFVIATRKISIVLARMDI